MSRAVAALLTLVGAVSVTSCDRSEGCQAGASTAVAAVEELLAAATNADAARACRVTGPMSEADLRANLGEIAAFVSGVGGMDFITVHEDSGRQMGSHLIVEVLVVDSPARVEFNVQQSGGRYLVMSGSDVLVEEPTTAPTPPAQTPASPSNG